MIVVEPSERLGKILDMAVKGRMPWEFCKQAANLYPNPVYGALLLFGTAMHESGKFRWRRQTSFLENSHRMAGGFSLWQLEPNSIETSVRYCQRKPDHEAKVQEFLKPYAQSLEVWNSRDVKQIAYLTMGTAGDPLGAILARLHYYWMTRKPLPTTDAVDDMYKYYKKYYNSVLGKATWFDWLDMWPYLVTVIRLIEKDPAYLEVDLIANPVNNVNEWEWIEQNILGERKP